MFSRRSLSFPSLQPPLPIDRHDFGEFIATSNFYHVWDFLELPSRSSVAQVEEGARRICGFSMGELIGFNAEKASPLDDPHALKEMCFRATFVTTFLSGAGFPKDYIVEAVNVINGQKVGWALGSMLYEINTLPWEFTEHSVKKLAPPLRNSTDMLMGRLAQSGGYEDSSISFGLGLFLVTVFSVGLTNSIKRLLARRYQNSRREAISSFKAGTYTDYGTQGGSMQLD